MFLCAVSISTIVLEHRPSFRKMVVEQALRTRLKPIVWVERFYCSPCYGNEDLVQKRITAF